MDTTTQLSRKDQDRTIVRSFVMLAVLYLTACVGVGVAQADTGEVALAIRQFFQNGLTRSDGSAGQTGDVPTKQADGSVKYAAAAGGSQTPWTGAINAASYGLTNGGVFTVSELNGDVYADVLQATGNTQLGNGAGDTHTITGDASISGTTSATVTAPIQRWSSGAGKTLTSAECRGHVYVVSGESAIPFTLPASPAAGDHVTFLLTSSVPLKITAGTDDSITLVDTTLSTNTDGYIYTTRNSSSVHLVWDSGTSNWYGTDVVGTWAFDSTTSAGYAYTPTPWTTFTATGSWTNVTYTACKYQQVGNLMRINYRLTVTGTPADAGQVYLDMPAGYTVDEAGIGSPYNGYVGGGSMTNTGSGAVYTVLWHYLTSVPNKFYAYDTAVPHAAVTKSSPAAVGSGFELDTYVTVPVD